MDNIQLCCIHTNCFGWWILIVTNCPDIFNLPLTVSIPTLKWKCTNSLYFQCEVSILCIQNFSFFLFFFFFFFFFFFLSKLKVFACSDCCLIEFEYFLQLLNSLMHSIFFLTSYFIIFYSKNCWSNGFSCFSFIVAKRVSCINSYFSYVTYGPAVVVQSSEFRDWDCRARVRGSFLTKDIQAC